MKHFFISLLLLFLLGIETFASDTMVSPRVLHSFQKTFTAAKDVSWTANQEIYKVEFFYSTQYITAYYNAAGNLLGLTKNILSTDLPVLLEKNLKEKYNDYWIADAMEVSTEDETVYYATLENADNKLVVKSFQNDWSLNKKIKK